MAKYRKKPVEIEAIQWLGNNYEEMRGFVKREAEIGLDHVYVYTLEGVMTADKGDYIIKGIKGEFYPCKPDIFDATYESNFDLTPEHKVTNDIFHKHYNESTLSSISNKDLLLLHSYLYKHELGELSEWKKIKREILRRMTI